MTGSMRIFDENLQTPYAQSWTAGVQRAIEQDDGRRGAVRRHASAAGAGATSTSTKSTSSRTASSTSSGWHRPTCRPTSRRPRQLVRLLRSGTGTSPLPTYLAYLTGSSQAGDASRYTASQFTNSTFVNRLAIYNPNADGRSRRSQRRRRRVAPTRCNAGLPANFFVVNPDLLGGATITGNGGYTRLQLAAGRAAAAAVEGLLVQAQLRLRQGVRSRRASRSARRSVENVGENDIRHAFKVNWVYELPFGRGRRFGAQRAPGFVDKLIGGWEFNGAGQRAERRLARASATSGSSG